MKRSRYLIYLIIVILWGGLLIGCKPRIDTMGHAEKMFIKMIDKAAKNLDLNEDQKANLEGLKAEIRKNFQEGQKEKKETLMKIKEEGMKENSDIQKMTSLLKGSFRDESQRLNRAFDLMLSFQSNLKEAQKKKLTQMISDWVKKWD